MCCLNYKRDSESDGDDPQVASLGMMDVIKMEKDLVGTGPPGLIKALLAVMILLVLHKAAVQSE